MRKIGEWMESKINRISIYICGALSTDHLGEVNNILWGIEEEGIPYSIKKETHSEAVKLGFLASQHSSLGIGIGIGSDQTVAIHHSKLKEGEPLLTGQLDDKPETLRLLGGNSARLVKKSVLKL